MKKYIIPHPNVANVEFGDAHLKKVTTLFNENFASLDGSVQSVQSSVTSLGSSKADEGHDHDTRYARVEHTHTLQDLSEVAALFDTKADIEHEHPQYLTEITAHQHAVSDVEGLIETLNGKAPIAHTHAFGEVDGLDDLAANVATTDMLAQRASEVLGAASNYTDGQISANVPKVGTSTPQSDTATGSVGSSVKYARADHRHTLNFPDDKSTTDIRSDGAGANGTPLFGSTDNYADLGHSHPLNFPDDRSADVLSPDGFGTGNTPDFGNSNYYADLYHSHPLNVSKTGLPSDVSKTEATTGSSGYYAREDHVHKLPALTGEDVTITSGVTVGSAVEELIETTEDHESRIAGLESGGGGGGTVKSVDGVSPGSNGDIDLKALTKTEYQGLASIETKIDSTNGQLELTSGSYVGGSVSNKVRLLGIAKNSYNVSAAESIGSDIVVVNDNQENLDEFLNVAGLQAGDILKVSSSPSGLRLDKVEFSADRVVVTNSEGKLSTTSTTPKSETVDVVTDVYWNNTQIVISSAKLTFENGLLTDITAYADDTIETVTYNPS